MATGTATGDHEIENLVAQLMLHSSQDTRHILNTLTESYRLECERLQAELERVRREVSVLVGGQYMPTPAAILDALYGVDTTPQA